MISIKMHCLKRILSGGVSFLLIFMFTVLFYRYSGFYKELNLLHRNLADENVVSSVLFSSYEARNFENNFFNVSNKRYLEFVRNRWIYEPSEENLSLDKMRDTYDYSQEDQSMFVNNLLHGKTNGFFVESGAANGEFISNSLFFEMALNWTGLLVEPSQGFFQEMLGKNRKAYLSNTCLNTRLVSEKREFVDNSWWGGIAGTLKDNTKEQSPNSLVQCFPLIVLLKALGITHVDYLSLDVEGAELDILKTLPFQQVHIEVIGIEYGQPSIEDKLRKLQLLIKFFENTGLYDQVGILPRKGETEKEIAINGLDVLFQHKKN